MLRVHHIVHEGPDDDPDEDEDAGFGEVASQKRGVMEQQLQNPGHDDHRGEDDDAVVFVPTPRGQTDLVVLLGRVILIRFIACSRS